MRKKIFDFMVILSLFYIFVNCTYALSSPDSKYSIKPSNRLQKIQWIEWSYDGKGILIFRNNNDQYRLSLISISKETGILKIKREFSFKYPIVRQNWIENGKAIIFNTKYKPWQIELLDLEKDNRKVLTKGIYPIPLPDGRGIIFLRSEKAGEGLNLYKLDLSNNAEKKIAENVSVREIQLSPNGKWLAIRYTRYGSVSQNASKTYHPLKIISIDDPNKCIELDKGGELILEGMGWEDAKIIFGRYRIETSPERKILEVIEYDTNSNKERIRSTKTFPVEGISLERYPTLSKDGRYIISFSVSSNSKEFGGRDYRSIIRMDTKNGNILKLSYPNKQKRLVAVHNGVEMITLTEDNEIWLGDFTTGRIKKLELSK